MNKWLLLGVVLLVFLVCLAVVIPNAISFARIDSWLERAKDAGNPAQVAEFLANYKADLDEAGLIKGKYYTFFKYPGTYMPTYIRAIDGLIERARALNNQSAIDTSYQMGLVNLEKDLGDLDVVAYLVWQAGGGVFWVISSWVFGIAAFCLWAIVSLLQFS